MFRFLPVLVLSLTWASGSDKSHADDNDAGTPSQWVEQLRSDNPATRLKAVRALRQHGPRASSATSALIALLEDDDPLIRIESARALGSIGPDASSATNALIALLEDDDPLIRIESARALGSIGPDASRAIPALVKRFDDHDFVLFEGFVWGAAAVAVGKIGAGAMPQLITLLEKEDWDRFLPVTQALHGVGPDAKQAVPFLLHSLEKKVDVASIRKASIYALGGIGAATDDVVPALIRMLRHSDFHTQYFACRALGEIGPPASAASRDLIGLTDTGVASVRRHAARALGNLGASAGQEVIQPLVQLIPDTAYGVRVEAVSALGNLGPRATAALPELRRGLADKQLRIPVESARSIWKVTGRVEEIIPVLVAELENLDNAKQAAELLGELGSEGKPAEQALIRASKSDDPILQAAAAAALDKVQGVRRRKQ